MTILVPDASTSIVAIMRRVKCIVDTGKDHKKPRDDGEYFVGYDGAGIMTVPLTEGVDLVDTFHRSEGDTRIRPDSAGGNWEIVEVMSVGDRIEDSMCL